MRPLLSTCPYPTRAFLRPWLSYPDLVPSTLWIRGYDTPFLFLTASSNLALCSIGVREQIAVLHLSHNLPLIQSWYPPRNFCHPQIHDLFRFISQSVLIGYRFPTSIHLDSSAALDPTSPVWINNSSKLFTTILRQIHRIPSILFAVELRPESAVRFLCTLHI